MRTTQKIKLMSDMQKTLQQEVTLSGIGLHTGKEVKLTMKPAKENTGFVFVRTDLEGHPQVEADVNYVVATERGTTLEKLGVKITTCEHLLAALVGCDIDNAILEMDASEPPILDGSSKYFVEAIESVGVVEQNVAREYLVVKEVLTYSDPATGSEITIIPSDTYEVTTMVDFGTKVLGTQNATLKNISEFKDEISSARTFSFLPKPAKTSSRLPFSYHRKTAAILTKPILLKWLRTMMRLFNFLKTHKKPLKIPF